MDNEKFQELLLQQLKTLTEGQKQLTEGQKQLSKRFASVENRLGTVEKGQTKLELRMENEVILKNPRLIRRLASA